MSILVDADTRLLVQGITGRDGSFHAMRCWDYGTNLVGGVTPGKGGADVEGVPVYNSVDQAVVRDRGQRCPDIRSRPPSPPTQSWSRRTPASP